MTLEILFFLFIFCWLFYGVPYAIGMAEYAKKNNKRSRQTELIKIKECLDCEVKELREALKERNIVDIVLESFDVLHSTIKYCIALISIRLLWLSLVWFMVFPFILPAGIKHADRYIRYNCIRNHQNKSNLDHICNYK